MNDLKYLKHIVIKRNNFPGHVEKGLLWQANGDFTNNPRGEFGIAGETPSKAYDAYVEAFGAYTDDWAKSEEAHGNGTQWEEWLERDRIRTSKT